MQRCAAVLAGALACMSSEGARAFSEEDVRLGAAAIATVGAVSPNPRARQAAGAATLYLAGSSVWRRWSDGSSLSRALLDEAASQALQHGLKPVKLQDVTKVKNFVVNVVGNFANSMTGSAVDEFYSDLSSAAVPQDDPKTSAPRSENMWRIARTHGMSATGGQEVPGTAECTIHLRRNQEVYELAQQTVQAGCLVVALPPRSAKSAQIIATCPNLGIRSENLIDIAKIGDDQIMHRSQISAYGQRATITQVYQRCAGRP